MNGRLVARLAIALPLAIAALSGCTLNVSGLSGLAGLLPPVVTPATAVPIDPAHIKETPPSAHPMTPCQARFNAADTNRDGFLDRAEFRTLWLGEHAPQSGVSNGTITAPCVVSDRPPLVPPASIKADPLMPIDPPDNPDEAMAPDPVMIDFYNLDENHDGKIGPDEFCTCETVPVPSPWHDASMPPSYGPSAPPLPTPTPMPLPTATPTPLITPTPTPVPSQASTTKALTFDAIDADHDGHITWQEYLNANLQAGVIREDQKDKLYDAFRQLDTNQNGTIEQPEFHVLDGSVWATPY